MINFTNCKEELNNYKGSEKKKTLIYENKKYLVKFPDPIREKNKSQKEITWSSLIRMKKPIPKKMSWIYFRLWHFIHFFSPLNSIPLEKRLCIIKIPFQRN